MKGLLFCLLCSFPGFLCAAELSDTSKREIDYLLQRMIAAECQFNRNGSWFSGPEAVAHIRKKYDYLLKKNMLDTTESFIEKAGSQSSMSGKPYEVRCKGQESVKSAVWFSDELRHYRAAQVPEALQ